MSKIIFISVHPDDETLGCGGTILRHKKSGDKIYWLIITNIDEKNGWEKKKVELRQKEILKVVEKYGFHSTYKLDFPTIKLDMVPINDLILSISNVINKVKPELIYLPNRSDIHTDHQIAFKAIMSCTKIFNYPFIKRILMYECLSGTEFSPPFSNEAFTPNVFVNITNFLDEKIKIMKIYKDEIKPFPFPRSEKNIISLASYRGATANVKYAEAFVLLKEIIG